MLKNCLPPLNQIVTSSTGSPIVGSQTKNIFLEESLPMSIWPAYWRFISMSTSFAHEKMLATYHLPKVIVDVWKRLDQVFWHMFSFVRRRRSIAVYAHLDSCHSRTCIQWYYHAGPEEIFLQKSSFRIFAVAHFEPSHPYSHGHWQSH